MVRDCLLVAFQVNPWSEVVQDIGPRSVPKYPWMLAGSKGFDIGSKVEFNPIEVLCVVLVLTIVLEVVMGAA